MKTSATQGGIMRSLKIIAAALLAALAGPAAHTQGPAPQAPVATPLSAKAAPPAAPAARAGGEPLERANVEAWLDGFMSYALPRGDVAGAVVLVVKDGETLYQKGSGYADVEARKPVDPQATLFRPGSVSTRFPWTAVMQPGEEERLDPDQELTAHPHLQPT